MKVKREDRAADDLRGVLSRTPHARACDGATTLCALDDQAQAEYIVTLGSLPARIRSGAYRLA